MGNTMISSMTAFANATEKMDEADITCELRSVNHRYLDIHLRMPESLRELEPAINTKIKGYLSRGKIDLSINIDKSVNTEQNIDLNQELVKTLIKTSSTLCERANNMITPLSSECILKWPGVLQKTDVDIKIIKNGLLHALEKTLKSANIVRQTEGRALKNLLDARIKGISTHIAAIKQQIPEIEQTRKMALEKKCEEVSIKLDPERLEQEMLIFLQKMDITEELDRLDTHLIELNNILTKGGVVGRKLDFMMQELNRETNTIASKSTNGDVTKHTVEMKVLIEQMREQIQNIE